MNDIEKGKKTAIIAYITIIGTVIAIFMNQDENKSEFASFHIRQALGVFLTWGILGYFVGNIDNWTMSIALLIFIFVLWFYGFLGCSKNEKRTVPLVGEFYQKFFKNL
ncbi:hypothetical protein [Flavobacterium sp.]|uniref:hypothetical protein n=1 Tax=Flavobacterium sp. TaxID=239 RepID=UPI003528F7A7